MATLPTQKKTLDPAQLNAADFRWFILHYPSAALKRGGIQRPSWVAVGLALSMHCDYKTGTKVRATKKLLHNQTGAHFDTVTKVLEVLKVVGALEFVEWHQSPNGGKPSEAFRFRRSPDVQRVLEKRDAQAWRIKDGNSTGEPSNSTGEPSNSTGEDNRNISNDMNCSVAKAPSPAPDVALSPDGASDGAEDEEMSINSFLAQADEDIVPGTQGDPVRDLVQGSEEALLWDDLVQSLNS